MPTLSISTTYVDGDPLTQAQLDEIKDGIEQFINSTKFDSDNIQNGGVTEACLASGAVTAAKLGTGAVETAKLDDMAVTTAKINDLAVTTGKINTAAVTQAKLEARPTASSATAGQIGLASTSTGTFSTSSTSFTTITNLTCSLTTTGRPVCVQVVPDGGTSDPGYVGIANTAGNTADAHIQILRGATVIGLHRLYGSFPGASSAEVAVPPTSVFCYDDVAAGTYTYTAKIKVVSGDAAYVRYCKLRAWEI